MNIKPIETIDNLDYDTAGRMRSAVRDLEEYKNNEGIYKFYSENDLAIDVSLLEKRVAAWDKVNKPEPGVYEIGDFELGPKAHLTDPCYDVGTWCMLSGVDVLAGTWRAYVWFHEDWGVRPFRLVAHHVYATEPFTMLNENLALRTEHARKWWQLIEGQVGVDSGQAGIFDADKYNEPSQDVFYETVSNQTLNLRKCGLVDGGVVSSTGYGDGGYGGYQVTENDHAVALAIDFYGDFYEEFEDADA